MKAIFKPLQATYRIARRIVVLVVGITVILFGFILIFTPGPALVVIPAGLAILGIEFAWARRWFRQIKDKGNEALTGKIPKATEKPNRNDKPA